MVKNKKVAVVGIGISNIPLISMLVKLDAIVTAFDQKEFDELDEEAKVLKDLNIEFILGKDYLNYLKGFDVIFKTPSMRIDSEELVNAKREGAYITSEMEEFIKYCPCKIIGVTGSDGKTTTTSLIYELLKKQGYKTFVGGNIGNPLLPRINEMSKDDRVVLELSSFQLMTIHESPQVAIVTNISPNHLDIHKDMKEYIQAKKNIFKYQTSKDLLVLNADNEITRGFIDEARGRPLVYRRVLTFSKKDRYADGYIYDGTIYMFGMILISADEVLIKGDYNLENLIAACLAVYNDVTIENTRYVARTFKGIPHRNEFIREKSGVKYYNNSIASSPTRTVAALSAFDGNVVLILGGHDKKISFEPLLEGMGKVKAAILFGETKYMIKEVLQDKVPLYIEDTLEDVVRRASEISRDGDVVLLAPACSSFDMFKNFEVRGDKFRELVMKL